MYFDDSRQKVESAAAAGIDAVLYANREQVANLVPAAARDPA